MALSTIQSPDTLSPVYSPMFYVTTSDYANETSFKYSFDIYDVDGLVVSKKVLPFPNKSGRTDGSPILKNKLTHSLLYNEHHTVDCPNSLIQYDMAVGHTGSTHVASPSKTGIKYALNAIDNDTDFYWKDYILSGSTGNFLTDADNIMVYDSDYYTLGYLNGVFASGATSSVKYIMITTYHGTGTTDTSMIMTDDYNYDPGSGATPVNVDSMVKVVGVGPKNLQDGGFGIIHDYTYKYEVYAWNSSLEQMSKKITFWCNHNAGRYDNVQIAFLNRLGQFSYHRFIGKTRVNVKSESSTFLKNRYQAVSGKWKTDPSKGGTTVWDKQATTEYVLTSDYVNQDTMTFMEQLFLSPVVYMLESSGPVPVIITDTTWEAKRKVNDKMINFTITVQLANSKKVNF